MAVDDQPLRLCVLVAAYNEAGNVVPLGERLNATLSKMGLVVRYIFVVQGADGTLEQVESLRPVVGEVEIFYSADPLGVGPAYRQGFSMLGQSDDLVVIIDADLNHMPESIPDLYQAMQTEQADMVIGSRYVGSGRLEGQPLWKRTASRIMNKLLSLMYGIDAVDKTGGYRLMRAELGQQAAARTRGQGFDFFFELLFYAQLAGAKIIEVPIVFRYRTVGVSKMYKLETAVNYLRLFWRLTFCRR